MSVAPVALQVPPHQLSESPVPNLLKNTVLTSQEFGKIERWRFTLAATPVTVDATNEWGGTIIADFPDYNFVLLNSEVNLVMTKTGFAAGDDVYVALGMATAADGALTGADADVLPVQQMTAASGADLAVTIQASRFTAAGATVPRSIVNTTGATPPQLFLNVGGPGSLLSANATPTFTGTIDLWLINVGNVTNT